MALHPDFNDPPNFSGLGAHDCPACTGVAPAYTERFPTMYVLNQHGQVSTADAEAVTPPAAPWMLRMCTSCHLTWPERTADNPRPAA